jgi:hypothetical protein
MVMLCHKNNMRETANNLIFMGDNHFNIGKATHAMGMARQPLAQIITIHMRERR